MSKVYVFLADGFEMIEGLTVVDIMRRAKIDVVTVSIKDRKKVKSSHNVFIAADKTFEEVDFEDADMLVLPGGMPGTTNLGAYEPLTELLKKFYKEGRKIAAICAAPSVFGKLGFLEGRKATSYPGFEEELLGAEIVEDAVVTDGNVTTSRGMGTAIDFALNLTAQLTDADTAEKIAKSIIYKA